MCLNIKTDSASSTVRKIWILALIVGGIEYEAALRLCMAEDEMASLITLAGRDDRLCDGPHRCHVPSGNPGGSFPSLDLIVFSDGDAPSAGEKDAEIRAALARGQGLLERGAGRRSSEAQGQERGAPSPAVNT